MDKSTPREAVCKVFENVNTGGVPLTVFELLTATFAADNFDLKEHWNKVKEIFEQYETLKKFDNTSFLIAMTLLIAMRKNSTVSCKRKDVLNLDYKDYEKNEEDLVNGFKKAYKLLVEMNIYSVYDIPYSTQLIPLAVICTLLDKEFENSSIKEKIKQWFWCGVFGELYGGANETRYALDVKQVYDWIKGKEELPKTINDCNFNTMRLLGLQTKNSAAYKGIMALILNNRSCDWINGMEMGVQTYLDERSHIHHIFPQDYCIKMNYDKKKWNSIINKTPLFFSTNRYIGGTSPSDYMNKIIRNKNISKEQLKSHISSHMINADLLENNKFEEFIIDRAIKILKDSINENLKKEEWRDIFLLRLQGKTLADIASEKEISRQRVKQVIDLAFSKISEVEEDKYKDLFENYMWTESLFCEFFNEESIVFRYLNLKYKMGYNDLIGLYNETISESQRNILDEYLECKVMTIGIMSLKLFY